MSRSICIIGAGPSGLVAAKTLLHNGPKGEFLIAVFDLQRTIGGLWPLSRTDKGRKTHPLMVANQSRQTVEFSDLAWDDDAPQFPQAWMVGKYLQRYFDTYLKNHADLELHLGRQISKAERLGAGWKVQIAADGNKEDETRIFDMLLVASGYFGEPIIPDCFRNASTSVPIIHSSQYRDLKDLLGEKGQQKGSKILVVGGQMSGVETAGTIASHLSSAIHSPDDCGMPSIDQYSVHHVIQKPIWVFPLYTTPEPTSSAPPFLPLDFSAYNLRHRDEPGPLANTQGYITEHRAQRLHARFEDSLGDQSDLSPLLQPTEAEMLQAPVIAISDWYCDFTRAGTITLSMGKIVRLQDGIATLAPGDSQIDDIAAVVLATGFDPSSCLSFLPEDALKTLQHAACHPKQALALAFHGTHHPDISNLGFVGFYRAPYWGVMEMQARFLASLWSHRKDAASKANLEQALRDDSSISQTVSLRDDDHVSQFPMGDYLFLMSEFARALSIKMQPPLVPLASDAPALDMLTPSRYTLPNNDESDALAKQETETSLRATRRLTMAALTTPRFVARAVFRSLLGSWRLERRLTSRLPSHPSGTFVGTAQFFLRHKTSDGLSCGGAPDDGYDGLDLEYLYVEDGEFRSESGFGCRATRRYVWRYDDRADRISVWFVRTDDTKRADYLFHEIEFMQHEPGRSCGEGGWAAKAGHLCIDDFYDVRYSFAFRAVNLSKWSIEYRVKGPQKDYTIHGTYWRESSRASNQG